MSPSLTPENIFSAASCGCIGFFVSWNPLTAGGLAVSAIAAERLVNNYPDFYRMATDLQTLLQRKWGIPHSNFLSGPLKHMKEVATRALLTASIAGALVPFLSMRRAVLITLPAIFAVKIASLTISHIQQYRDSLPPQ